MSAYPLWNEDFACNSFVMNILHVTKSVTPMNGGIYENKGGRGYLPRDLEREVRSDSARRGRAAEGGENVAAVEEGNAEDES